MKMRKPSTRFRPLVLLLVLCMLCMSVFASAPPAGEAPPGGPGGPPPDGGAGGPGGPGGPVEELVQSSYFSDVTGEFVDAIDAMYEKGLINGVAAPAAGSPGLFSPDTAIKRGDFVLMLSRVLNAPAPGSVSAFSDVAPTAYYAEAIGQAYELGLISGDGDGLFRPEDSISREEAFSILWRAADEGLIEGCTVQPGEEWCHTIFSDAGELDSWAVEAIDSLVASDVLTGETLEPKADCTRIDLAITLNTLVQTDRSSQLAPDDYDEVFILVHTNDVHGYIQTEPQVKTVKAYYQGVYGEDHVALVSAGDIYAGGAAVAHYYLGEAIVDVMDASGYDYIVLGNSEFNLENDHPGQVEKLIDMAQYQSIAANMYHADGEGVPTDELVCEPYAVLTTDNGSKIGLFGLAMLGSGLRNPKPDSPYNYYIRDDVAVSNETIAELEALGCGTIIGIGHKGWTGIPTDEDIAAAAERDPEASAASRGEIPLGDSYSSGMIASVVDGMDVFVDGHSHSIIEDGMGWLSDKGCLVVQAGEKGNAVGVVKLYLKDGQCIKAVADVLNEADLRAFPADPDAQAVVDAVYARYEEDTARPVGETPYYLNANRLSGNNNERGIRTDEQNIGDIITDAIAWKLDADVALFASVNIRASIEAGPVSLGDWFGVFAIGGELNVFEMTGEELLNDIAGGLTALPNEAPSFNQVSGIKFGYVLSDDTVTIVNPTIGGEALDPAATYLVAKDPNGSTDSDSSVELLLRGMEDMAGLMAEYMQSEACVFYPDTAHPDNRVVPMDGVPEGAAVYVFEKGSGGGPG